jgi:hypothetical protein
MYTLLRHQFVELLIRIAFLKFYKTKIEKSPAAAFIRLVETHLHCDYEQSGFRDYLWIKDVNQVYRANQYNLKNVYARLKKAQKLLPLNNLKAIVDKVIEHQPDALPMDKAKFQEIFSLSKLTIINEVLDFNRYKSLEYHEFLEAIARCAQHMFTSKTNVSRTLARKIEIMLDGVFEEFELYRHKVANDDGASSSGDDEYED